MKKLLTVLTIILLTACNAPQETEKIKSALERMQDNRAALITRTAQWKGEAGEYSIAKIEFKNIETGETAKGIAISHASENEYGYLDESEIKAFCKAIDHISAKMSTGFAGKGGRGIYRSETGLVCGSFADLLNWKTFLKLHSTASMRIIEPAHLAGIAAKIKEIYPSP